MRGCFVLLSGILVVLLGVLRVGFGAGYPENQWIGWLLIGAVWAALLVLAVVACSWAREG